MSCQLTTLLNFEQLGPGRQENSKEYDIDFHREVRKISSFWMIKAMVNTIVSTLGKIFSRRYIKLFSYLSQKTGFDRSCKFSLMEKICMKCQILFSGEKKKRKISPICDLLNLPRKKG